MRKTRTKDAEMCLDPDKRQNITRMSRERDMRRWENWQIHTHLHPHHLQNLALCCLGEKCWPCRLHFLCPIARSTQFPCSLSDRSIAEMEHTKIHERTSPKTKIKKIHVFFCFFVLSCRSPSVCDWGESDLDIASEGKERAVVACCTSLKKRYSNSLIRYKILFLFLKNNFMMR